jgi:glycosyltransferase involved in cell wall biosynthesis
VSQRLRVGLVGLIAAGYSGVSRYAASLIAALDEVAPANGDLSFDLLTTPYAAGRLRPDNLNVRIVRTFGKARSGPPRILGEQIAALHSSVDLLHFFDLSGPLLRPSRRFVTTVHDAGPAHGHQRRRHSYKRLVQPWALRHAAAAVAVSAFARDEAVRLLGAREDSVTVIRSGPGLPSPPVVAPNAGEHRDYFLYVGELTTHKNLVFLIDAFEAAGLQHRLVLAGRRREGFDQIRARIDAVASPARVDVLEDVDDARLEQLYGGALAVVLPSRYEGFGFTPLEAMARGCPVVASDIPALREIVGEAALLCAVDDRAAWIDALRKVSGDGTLREDLRARGRQCVEQYSWHRTAQELCDLFKRAA